MCIVLSLKAYMLHILAPGIAGTFRVSFFSLTTNTDPISRAGGCLSAENCLLFWYIPSQEYLQKDLSAI